MGHSVEATLAQGAQKNPFVAFTPGEGCRIKRVLSASMPGNVPFAQEMLPGPQLCWLTCHFFLKDLLVLRVRYKRAIPPLHHVPSPASLASCCAAEALPFPTPHLLGAQCIACGVSWHLYLLFQVQTWKNEQGACSYGQHEM